MPSASCDATMTSVLDLLKEVLCEHGSTAPFAEHQSRLLSEPTVLLVNSVVSQKRSVILSRQYMDQDHELL